MLPRTALICTMALLTAGCESYRSRDSRTEVTRYDRDDERHTVASQYGDDRDRYEDRESESSRGLASSHRQVMTTAEEAYRPQRVMRAGFTDTRNVGDTVSAPQGRVTAAGMDFIRKAASGGKMEVELGRIAAQQASSERVRAFGQRMVDDHTQANEDLMAVTKAMGVEFPQQMLPEHQQHVDHLTKLQGADFDRQYVDMMLNDHRADVAEFDRQVTQANEGELRGFAMRTLPTLKEHLEQIETIAGETGSGQRSAR